MNNVVFLYSPMDPLYLNITIHSLFLASRFSQTKVFFGSREGDNQEVLELVWSLKDHLTIIGPTPSLRESLRGMREDLGEDLGEDLWSEEIILLVPPGAVFLQEGLIETINAMFKEDDNLGFVFAGIQVVEEAEKSYSFPSILSPMVVRGDIFRRTDLSEVPDVGIGAFLSQETQKQKRGELHHKDLGIYTYPSCLSGVLWDEVKIQWEETIAKLKQKKGGL